MIEVNQRRMIPAHVATNEEVMALPRHQRGDCMRAAIASLFEIAYEDAFDCFEDEDWWGGFETWLAGFGLYCTVKPAAERAPFKGLYLVDGKSPRGDWGHMAVGRFAKLDEQSWGWEVVFDPHPSRAGFDGEVQNIWELHCFDPARLQRRAA